VKGTTDSGQRTTAQLTGGEDKNQQMLDGSVLVAQAALDR